MRTLISYLPIDQILQRLQHKERAPAPRARVGARARTEPERAPHPALVLRARPARSARAVGHTGQKRSNAGSGRHLGRRALARQREVAAVGGAARVGREEEAQEHDRLTTPHHHEAMARTVLL
jgi:hypothetical protein